ncbi:MAG: SMP-30/gluconolactonase/LRE family protein [Planctomycetia bacterium]|nr:SMP-30/gluconolactonase/LRE family protein [Planctomycetia bacterium]
MSALASTPLPAGLAALPKPAVVLSFTEGPAVDADGTVYFSDIIGNRIMRRSPEGVVSVFREPSGRTNGNTFDLQGRLLHCEGAEFGPGGNRRITRTDLKTGRYEVLSERYEGVRYNAPNDICVDGRGRIYFTDPMYFDRTQMDMQQEGVYRIDLDGRVVRILEQPMIQRPNGIAVTQDCRQLYVIDSCPTRGGNRKVWNFRLDDEGNPHDRRLVFDFAPGRGGDGMRLDIAGNLWIAAGIAAPRGPHETADVPTGIYQVSPQGTLLGRIPIGEDVITNLAFGGADGKTLYVTAGKTLFTLQVPVAGQVAFPKWTE